MKLSFDRVTSALALTFRNTLNKFIGEVEENFTETVANTKKAQDDAAEAISTANEAKMKSDNAQEQVNTLVVRAGESSPQVLQALTNSDGETFSTLKGVLDSKDQRIKEKADITYVDTKLSSVASGSPKGTYATLADLQTAFPTGATGIYIVSADGKWYYWNSSAWSPGGVYQSTGFGDNTIQRQYLTQSAKVGYPFAPMSTFLYSGYDLSNVGKAVKNLTIFNASTTDKFYFERIRLSSGTLTIHLGKVGWLNPASTGSGEICASLVINNFVATDAVTSVTFTANNGTNISANMVVNWAEMDVAGLNTAKPLNKFTYDICGFHQNCIFNVDLTKYDLTKLVGIPNTIYCAVGREVNLYYRNMVNLDDPSEYFVEVKDLEATECLIMKKCMRIKPTKAFTAQMKINLYKGSLLLGTLKPNVISVEDTKKTMSLLCIGDSITANAKYTAELLNINPNLTLLGTRGSGTNKHEGRAGWTADNYVKNASVDTVTNAFYNPSTSKFDFSYYMTQNPISTPTFVLINLGINDVAQKIPNDTTISNLQIMINSIRAYNSNIKILLCLPIPPSTERVDQHYLNMTSLYDAILKNFANENIPCLNLVLDRETSFPTTTTQMSARDTTLVTKVTDTIHPIDAGYFQMADALYGYLNAI